MPSRRDFPSQISSPRFYPKGSAVLLFLSLYDIRRRRPLTSLAFDWTAPRGEARPLRGTASRLVERRPPSEVRISEAAGLGRKSEGRRLRYGGRWADLLRAPVWSGGAVAGQPAPAAGGLPDPPAQRHREPRRRSRDRRAAAAPSRNPRQPLGIPRPVRAADSLRPPVRTGGRGLRREGRGQACSSWGRKALKMALRGAGLEAGGGGAKAI